MNNKAKTLHSPEAAKRPLGIAAKCASPEQQQKQMQDRREQRFAALDQARHWLRGRASQIDPSAFAGDLFRTVDCRFARTADNVSVFFDAEHQAAVLGGVATCGSVWACPVCATKIQQRRRGELSTLLDWSYSQGFTPLMVTLTFPHTRFDSLADLLSKQRAAFKLLRSGKAWQDFKKRYGFGGLVRSLELTHGANGWHPHTHELWLCRLSLSDQASFLDFLRSRWAACCAKVGLLDRANAVQDRAFLLHSVDVRFEVSSSDYLCKQDQSRAWGADRELASSTSKQGRSSGVHPHEFLIRQAPGDAALYLEYVVSMKGARQLFWSHGLKAACGVADLTDEEVAQVEEAQAESLITLDPDRWAVVRGNSAVPFLLSAAEFSGRAGVLQLLEILGSPLQPHELYELRQLGVIHPQQL